MNRVALDLGIVQIYWYSLCILVGMMIGMFLVYKEVTKKGISDVLITNLIFYTVVISIIGARLYYVIFDWGYYSKNPLEILEIWNGGLAIHGAIILGGLFLIYYTKQHKMNTLKILDICSVGLIIGQAIGRWGNFFNQEVYGTEVSLGFLKGLHLPKFIIDGMHINGVYHHPLFLYESLLCIIGFVLLLIIRRRKYIKTGQIFGIYCMWYSLGRFFLEGMRDSKYNLMFGNLKAAQIVSIGMFIVGLFFFIRRFKSSRFEFLYNDESVSVESTIKQNERVTKKTKSFKDHQQVAQQLNIENTIPPISNTPSTVEQPKVEETKQEPIPNTVEPSVQQEELNNPFMVTSNNEQPIINKEMQNQEISTNPPVPMVTNVNSQVQQNDPLVALINQNQPQNDLNNNVASQIPNSVLGNQQQNTINNNQMPVDNNSAQETGKKNKFIN
jgi:phosphatidylglycerol:prolipoprotein diacylglycerol transferase